MSLFELLQDPVEGKAFMACLGQPSSVEARVAYAAVLDGIGDPRGELLRLEVLLQDPAPGSDYAVERARLDVLVSQVSEMWWDAVRLSHPIHNCGQPGEGSAHVRFAFKCPALWSSLAPTAQPGVRHCGGCDERVYLCRSGAEVEAHARAGRCVAIERELYAGAASAMTSTMTGRPDVRALWARRVLGDQG